MFLRRVYDDEECDERNHTDLFLGLHSSCFFFFLDIPMSLEFFHAETLVLGDVCFRRWLARCRLELQ